MNFTQTEINTFKATLRGKYMFGETSHGNIEFIPRSMIGQVGVIPFRLCRKKEDGKLYFCKANGENSRMFNHTERISKRMKVDGRWGTFTSTDSTYEQFDTVKEAAVRFNKYAKKKIK